VNLCQSRCRRRPRGLDRRAFTLVELIVVIGIFGILIGLLGGSIQKARERAARLVCADNLRQTALALHGYHSIHRVFPYGTTPDETLETMPYLSWHARLLPLIESDALWRGVEDAYRTDRDFRRVPPHVLRNRVIPKFICPTDPRSSSPSSINPRVALTSYLGVQGIDFKSKDGVFFLGSRISLFDIQDGASSTLLVGERPPSWDDEYGWWYAGWGAQRTGTYDSELGVRETQIFTSGEDMACPTRGVFHFGPGTLSQPCDRNHFWSLHPGGANFAFADGSVRFLGYSADPILPSLATRAGGEPVGVPD
jgi:prepilin-type processing-associated H-X9-DG protein/prepilin-type N-terminal cleavage/methylation domain-containing protein